MRRYLILLLIPVLAVAVATATAVKPKPKSLQLRSTDLGRVIVDSKKRTLYMLTADGKNSSSCSGQCAANWPPAKAPKKPTLVKALKKDRLKVIRRSDGTRQLAYRGHPLYRFAGDSRPGDVNGQGVNAFGGSWYVLGRSGAPVMAAPASGY